MSVFPRVRRSIDPVQEVEQHVDRRRGVRGQREIERSIDRRRKSDDTRSRLTYTYAIGPYFVNDVAAGTTQATRMYFNTATATNRSSNEQLMDCSGVVVGIIMSSDVSISSGTITAQVRINGTGQTFNGGACQLSTSKPTSVSSHTSPGSGVPFVAGQTVGAEVVASVGIAPNNIDLDIMLVLETYPLG